jgi:hypothetical protein
MATETLRVRLNDVLYRSRGRDWDYAFLLQPEPLLGEGWYALHRRIFSNVEPGREPELLRGTLGIGTGHPFLATAFTDDRRRDCQARPIAHYLTWLGSSAAAAPNCSFGPPLIAALAPALEAVFELAPLALKQAETKPLDALLRRRFAAALSVTELELCCEQSSRLRLLGTLAP